MKDGKVIPGFSRYKACADGDIISVRRQAVMAPYKNKKGYMVIGLCNDEGVKKCTTTHRLVWMAFNGPIPVGLQVDHIDNNPSNNHITNLQLLTNRENVVKGKIRKPKSSRYTGVSWDRCRNRFKACIKLNNRSKYLGVFKDEYEAHLVYERALAAILNG